MISYDERRVILMRILQRCFLPVGIIIVFLLAGCGHNAGSGGSGGSGNTPSPTGMPPTQPVTLHPGATSYTPGSSISVTIKNESGQAIYFADHRTNCTVLLVERQVSGAWVPVAPCKLMIMTRILSLSAGAVSNITLITTNQWPTGNYHVRLDYSFKQNIGNGGPTPVYSNMFHLS